MRQRRRGPFGHLRRVAEERLHQVAPKADDKTHAETMMDMEMYEAGLAARKRVLTEPYVEKALQSADKFTQEFQTFITTYCWGEVWTKTVLTDKQRSMNNLCMTAALNKWAEFELHFRGAMRNGLSLAELRDVLLQITVYCGVPCGVEAFRHARNVLTADGIDPDKEGSL